MNGHRTADISDRTTSQRILNAAGEVFAEKGFRAATVREICRRAKANLAAVNYHFRDKQTLYAAVLNYACAEALRQYPPAAGVTTGASTTERLRSFVRSFLFRLLDEGRPSWHGRLIAREMFEPTPVLDELIRTSIAPQREILAAIVREQLGPRASAETVRACIASIQGQCLYYFHTRSVLERLHPDWRFNTAEIGRIAEHITAFSLLALDGLKKKNGK